MNFIRTVLGFIIAVAAIAFAVMNRQSAEVVWSPIHDSLQIPVYLIALAAMAAGFVLGGIVVWFNGGKVRSEKRKQKKIIRKLETELEQVQGQNDNDPAAELFPALPGTRH